MTDNTLSGLAWSGKLSAVHWVVVLFSLALTLGAWQYSKRQVESRILARYETERDRVVSLISVRMEKYEEALWAGVSTIYSHDENMSHAQWMQFSGSLSIETRYPGINGIGVIHFMDRDEIKEYLSKQRVDRPDFDIHPPHDLPFVTPITHIQPEDINIQAVGLDVAHETNRRTALLKSRDTGTAQITGPIVLVQDAAHTPGFLFYAPFYRGGTPENPEDRKERFLGAVYAPFVVSKLMQGVLAENKRQVSFVIRDENEIIYDENTVKGEFRDAKPLYSETVPLNLYGRTWDLDIRTNLAFRTNNTSAQPWIILLGGLLIDTLLLALFTLMSNANHRAVRHAESLHGKLLEKTERLEVSNRELEKIIYFASHDLKTPIRGIGGLTEMVIEDLEGYFTTAQADPGIRANLDMILDRVRRMENLAKAVLEYSRVGKDELEQDPVNLAELLSTISVDFDLRPDQLELSGSTDAIQIDPLGFRRVLENLVGNAAKYHHNLEMLKISIEIHDHDDFHHISVRDNGPGIDEAYHDSIFLMFQKVGSGKKVESSGIGLAIVKKTIEMHGGKITLKSRPGQGADFSFDWPKNVDNTISAVA